LTDVLAEADLAHLLAAEAPAPARCEALIQAANQRESQDNITAIVIRVIVPVGGMKARSPKRAR
jgi:serine/threonine protein phosphatase PrpC